MFLQKADPKGHCFLNKHLEVIAGPKKSTPNGLLNIKLDVLLGVFPNTTKNITDVVYYRRLGIWRGLLILLFSFLRKLKFESISIHEENYQFDYQELKGKFKKIKKYE